MARIESRMEKLEAVLKVDDLVNMTDEQLSMHISTLPFKSPAMYAGVIALVLRHPSALPVAQQTR